MKINFVFLVFIIFYFLFSNTQANIEIKLKIDNEIVTNIDIKNEEKYLSFLRPNLKNLPDNEMKKIAQNSLVREIIKKKELKRIFNDEDQNKKLMEEIKKNLFKFKNVSNENEFINLTKKNGIEYDIILEKMKYEAMWNELIFQKYSTFVKVDDNKLKKDLKIKITKNKKFEYNLSEILFDIKKDENLDQKYQKVLKYAKNNTFKIAATKFSISNSSNKGGEIGWVKETLLSENLNNMLGKMKIGEISTPIKYPNGYLILKVIDKKEMKQIINLERELNDLINFEKNKQLNQFSLLFYKKLKQNTIINEY